MFLPKNEPTNLTLLLVDLLSFVILKKVKAPKRHFEISWPLGSPQERWNFNFQCEHFYLRGRFLFLWYQNRDQIFLFTIRSCFVKNWNFLSQCIPLLCSNKSEKTETKITTAWKIFNNCFFCKFRSVKGDFDFWKLWIENSAIKPDLYDPLVLLLKYGKNSHWRIDNNYIDVQLKDLWVPLGPATALWSRINDLIWKFKH